MRINMRDATVNFPLLQAADAALQAVVVVDKDNPTMAERAAIKAAQHEREKKRNACFVEIGAPIEHPWKSSL